MKPYVKFTKSEHTFKANFGQVHRVTEYAGGEPYEGPHTVTPTNETQVLETKNKVMSENLIVNPIPNNYGLVTYNQDRNLTIT